MSKLGGLKQWICHAFTDHNDSELRGHTERVKGKPQEFYYRCKRCGYTYWNHLPPEGFDVRETCKHCKHFTYKSGLFVEFTNDKFEYDGLRERLGTGTYDSDSCDAWQDENSWSFWDDYDQDDKFWNEVALEEVAHGGGDDDE